MCESTNQTDKQGLRKFMQTYTKLIYSRASLRMQDHELAMEATRATLAALSDAVEEGRSHPDTVPWLMALTDNCCLRLISQTDEPSAAQDTPQHIPAEAPLAKVPAPEPQPEIVESIEKQQSPAIPPVPMARTSLADRPVLSARAQRTEAKAISPMPETRRTNERLEKKAIGRPSENQEIDLFFETDTRRNRRMDKKRISPQHVQEEPALESEFEGESEQEAGLGMVFLLFFLVIVVLALLWLLVVMLMQKGIIPNADIGFAEWFNNNVFELF